MTTEMCPVCGRPAFITTQQQDEQGQSLVEPFLLIEGCDCLRFALDNVLPGIFRTLKYDYERDVLRDLPKYFRQEAQKGNPIHFSYKDFLRFVDDRRQRMGI